MYQGKPEQIKNRDARNKGRKMLADKLGKKPTQIKGDVAHKKAIDKGGKTTLMNLFVESASGNRSFARDSKSNLKSEVSKRERKKKK